jgi:outer membrane lipoprotein SlyB
MSTLKQRGAMALLLCVAVAACSTNRGYDSNSASTMGSSGTSNSSMASTSASYGTVQSIDPGTRQDIGVGTLGAAAAGGSMGSPSDKVYRVTVRMDDGTTQSMVMDSMPSAYKVGDRVRYSNGSLQRSTQ